MACNPPTCLEIPPAIPTGTGFCGFKLHWYRQLFPGTNIPILFAESGLTLTDLQVLLRNIASAGGLVYDITYMYLDPATGICSLAVSVTFPVGGGGKTDVPVCPAGFYYSPSLEKCVCVGEPVCVATCLSTGVLSVDECNEACCISVFPPGGPPPPPGGPPPPPGGPPPGGKFDAPVPRGAHDLASLVTRSRSPVIERFPAGVGLSQSPFHRSFVRFGASRFTEMPRNVLFKNPTLRGAPVPIIGGCGCGLGDNYEEEVT